MRRVPVAALGASLLLTGCLFGGSDPEESPMGSTRSQCDRFAAQAIQEPDLARATNLAAQAAECYASLQNVRR